MDDDLVDFDAPMTEAELMSALLKELRSLAFIDIGGLYDENNRLLDIKQMDPAVRRAIAAIEVDEIWSGTGAVREVIGYTKKVKLWDKKGSIDSFMKHLGMFIERLEVNSQVVVKVEQFDLDERLESLRGIN